MKNLVKLQLSRYLSKELSKEMLYQWAVDLLHEMLKGDIFKINYLEIWGIITGLAEIDDMDDYYCDEMVQRFLRILLGDENAAFTFAMKIPEKFVVSNLSEVEKIVKKISMGERLSLDEVEDLKLIMNKKLHTYHTLNELLEVQIIDILKWGYGLCNDENSIQFEPKSMVFINEDEAVSLEARFLSTAITLLECYEGRRCFFVYINYDNGVGNISVQV
ncbi:MAG: hypothetical protein HDR19_02555 [Lachnospiraceae bacterium]|nr:hypothetical protein [Lachnospiraceae bacterium]